MEGDVLKPLNQRVFQRIPLGLPGVVRAIPEMEERIFHQFSLVE